jgi:hypothetical protein
VAAEYVIRPLEKLKINIGKNCENVYCIEDLIRKKFSHDLYYKYKAHVTSKMLLFRSKTMHTTLTNLKHGY